MNMMTKAEILEEIETEEDYAPRNVEGRLREWNRVRWYAPVNPWPPTSGVHAVLHNPGRATNVQSDGGLYALCERGGWRIAREVRVREVQDALNAIPVQLGQFVRYIYEVPQRERSRSERSCAEHFGVSREDCARVLARAYGWLERELNIVCPLDVMVRGKQCG